MTQFTKGQGGRPQGAKNTVTQIVRKHFETLICKNLEQLQKDIEALEPKDRIKVVIDLSKFVIPTLKSIESSALETEKPTEINIIIERHEPPIEGK
jgi:hypothetical protein